MITIVACLRSITNYGIVKEAIKKSGFDITCIILGDIQDVDSLGGTVRKGKKGIELKQFPANDEDFLKPCIHRSTCMASRDIAGVAVSRYVRQSLRPA